MKRIALALPIPLLLVGACTSRHSDLGREPMLTPVGHGLHVTAEPIPVVFAGGGRRSRESLWDDRSADLYRDPRAKRIGDIITVNILIDDKAQFDNASDRSRNSKVGLGLDFGVDGGIGAYEGTAKADLKSSSSSSGQGMIDRSEKLRLSLAAVVTDVLPNGNLLIAGSQEVRVNYEVRVLNIAGVVKPSDVSRRNTIGYDKIAEARVSYGGRGRIMEVQQPGWGQQIYDTVVPF